MNSDVAREVHDRAEGMCEAMIPPACQFTPDHLHHRQMRSQGGGDTVNNLLVVCHVCHAWIHGHTGRAYEWGLLVKSWDEPVFPPRFYRGRLTTHDDSKMKG